MTLETATGWIQKSGYPDRCGWVALADGRPVLKTTLYDDIARLMSGPKPKRFMCHACWSFQPPYEDPCQRLGISGYCQHCTEVFVTRCITTHERLPFSGEFWCRSCNEIRPVVERCEEWNGVKRMVCRPCRVAVVRRAAERFKAKKRAAFG